MDVASSPAVIPMEVTRGRERAQGRKKCHLEGTIAREQRPMGSHLQMDSF